MHTHFRDCDAWRQEKLPMNTTSNEAAKLYDVSLSQLVGWYENPHYNGLMGSLTTMTKTDPDFILGECLKLGIELLGANELLINKESHKRVDDFVKKAADLMSKSELTEREFMHVKAIEQLQKGNIIQACNFWENILIEHPTDLLAIKMAHTSYFFTGQKRELRDSIARVMPSWNKSLPLYGYLYGMHAFGLTQTCQQELARIDALKGLELNPSDIWSTHAIIHTNEYTSNYKEGIQFLLDTEKDWSVCSLLKPHSYWHLSLFYMENNQHNEAIDIFEKHVRKQDDMCNSAAFLLRMKINGYNYSNLETKWNDLKNEFINKIEHHGYLYNDWHMAMILGACGTQDEKNRFLKSLNEFIDSPDLNEDNFKVDTNEIVKLPNFNIINNNYLKDVNKELAPSLFNSIFYYNNGEYDKAVDLLYPIRYNLHKIGGSNAQTDVFNQMLIDSCLKSSVSLHNKLGLALVNERLSLRPNSDLTKRMASRFINAEDL